MTIDLANLRPRLAPLVVLVAIASCAGLDIRRGCGQDDWDAARKVPGQPGAEFMVAPVMGQVDFNQWVYGGRNSDQVQRTLETLLALRIEAIARQCKLSGEQKKRLELAGHGDLVRLTRSVESLRDKYHQVGQDQQKFQEFAQQVGPVQLKLQTGVFGENSLFSKTLKRTVNPEQSALYEQEELQRRKFRYEAKIELVVAMLESTIPLRNDQRQKFVKVLLEETRPPKKTGQYDYYVVLYQAGKLPDEKLKPIFDDAQWQALKRTLEQSRHMERFLQSNGILP